MHGKHGTHGTHGTHDFIWLASQSPRRRELLGQIGVAHQLLLPEAGEGVQAREVLETLEALEAHRVGETPAAYVVRVTDLKLQAARRRLQARHAALGVPLPFVETVIEQVKASGKLIAADMAELNPNFDRDGQTARVGARLLARVAGLPG